MHNKIAIVSGLFATLLATSAFAADAVPLLKKSQNSGFTPPEFHQSLECSVFADKVVIVRSFGGTVTATEERAVVLAGEVEKLIAAAASEAFVAEATICDAPGTSVSAIVKEGEELLLHGVSTCSKDGTRNGKNSMILLNIANSLCGDMR